MAHPITTIPRWLTVFLLAQGALLALSFDGSLGEVGTKLARLALSGSALWYALHRRRLFRERDQAREAESLPSWFN